ncbi:hypothetical protein M422DRAFT_251910 [Sphaerobolus stellatus SS14]|uniref:Uncharacterized protein n=1 Tax=Sphaerobolus stellatus (strain SS14) TaxID=990650 RepID=A0A0C9UNM7_SPHS4|nr:hypothetical protein M422DRAFT_251910 [Sphaerobolus stellatus SS14]
MSYTSIFGNFTVRNGTTLLLHGKTYALYASELITEDFEYVIPVLIYHRLRGGDILVNNAAPVFLYGSIILQPEGHPFLIEALNLFGYGGPIDGTIIPKFCPRISVLGHIGDYPLSNFQGYQAFKVHSSSSVKDEVGQNCFMAICNISFCSVDLSRLREGSTIGIIGPICFKDGSGLPMLYVEAVTNDLAMESGGILGLSQVRCGIPAVNSLGLVTSGFVAVGNCVEPSSLNGSIIPSLSRYLLNEDPAKTVSPSVLMSDHLTQSMGSVECSDTEDLDPDSNIGAHESRPSSENPELMDLSGRNDDSSSKTADPRLSKMNAVLDVAEPVSAPRSPPCLDPPPEFHPSFVGNREVCYPQFGEGTPRTELVNVGGRVSSYSSLTFSSSN